MKVWWVMFDDGFLADPVQRRHRAMLSLKIAATLQRLGKLSILLIVAPCVCFGAVRIIDLAPHQLNDELLKDLSVRCGKGLGFLQQVIRQFDGDLHSVLQVSASSLQS